MEMIKSENQNELYFIDKNNNKFKIHYAGGDLYWTMYDYYDNNEFIIEQEEEFFSYLEQLFMKIEENDYCEPKLLNDNRFEWISEAYGIPEEANKLIIIKEENKFIINFYQNPIRLLNKNLCPVCFCLSGSKNPIIASAFSIMFHEYIESINQRVKTKTS